MIADVEHGILQGKFFPTYVDRLSYFHFRRLHQRILQSKCRTLILEENCLQGIL